MAPTLLPLTPLSAPELFDSSYREARDAIGQDSRAASPMGILARLLPGEYNALLATVAKDLAHMRYAVCGSAALALWREQDEQKQWQEKRRSPPTLSILCSRSTMDVLAAWAASIGWLTDPTQPGVFGVRDPDGHDCYYPLHVSWMDDDAFEKLESVAMFVAPSGNPDSPDAAAFRVPVLSLAALVSRAAHEYAYGDAVATSPAARHALAQEICWLLEHLAAASSYDMDASWRCLPALLDPLFHDVFAAMNPEFEQLVPPPDRTVTVPPSQSHGSGHATRGNRLSAALPLAMSRRSKREFIRRLMEQLLQRMLVKVQHAERLEM